MIAIHTNMPVAEGHELLWLLCISYGGGMAMMALRFGATG